MFIAKLLKYHLIYLCYFEILLKVNCSPFRSTRVHPGYLQGSCCSIFSFLCRILLIIVCLFVLFLLTILFSVFFNIQILITSLWYLLTFLMFVVRFSSTHHCRFSSTQHCRFSSTQHCRFSSTQHCRFSSTHHCRFSSTHHCRFSSSHHCSKKK